MVFCRDKRWHANQEEADACMKHANGKHFRTLSTVSRVHKRTRNTFRPPSPESSAGAPPVQLDPQPGLELELEPEPDTTTPPPQTQPSNEINNTIDQPPPPETTPTPLDPGHLAQTGKLDTMQSMNDWLTNVPSEISPVPSNNLSNSDIHDQHSRNDEAAQLPNMPPPENGPRTPPPLTGPSSEGGTPPRIRRILNTIELRAWYRDEYGTYNHTPMRQPALVNLPPIEAYRPWFAGENAWMMYRTSVGALFCAFVVCMVLLAGANRDAERFP